MSREQGENLIEEEYVFPLLTNRHESEKAHIIYNDEGNSLS